jgi:NAD(P)-dependent dehydrogenase (short-subunit alcohol dehydrogenase family)
VHTNALCATVGDETATRLEAAVRAVVPARRLVTLEEVGDLVALLAGDELSWFNGATLDFTGGEIQSLWDYIVHQPPGDRA